MIQEKCDCGTPYHGEDADAKETNICHEDDKFEDDIVESDIEFDNTDVVEPDNDPPQKVCGKKIDKDEVDVDICFRLKRNCSHYVIADGRSIN